MEPEHDPLANRVTRVTQCDNRPKKKKKKKDEGSSDREKQTTQSGERNNPEVVEELFLSLSKQHKPVSIAFPNRS
jgi:hypothetical protein